VLLRAILASAEALRPFLVEARKKAGLTQAELASKLGEYQSFVALRMIHQRCARARHRSD
jgi:hypothetical protein